MGSGPEYGSTSYTPYNINYSGWGGYQQGPYSPSQSVMNYLRPEPLINQYWNTVTANTPGIESYPFGGTEPSGTGSGPYGLPGDYTDIRQAISDWGKAAFHNKMNQLTGGMWFRGPGAAYLAEAQALAAHGGRGVNRGLFDPTDPIGYNLDYGNDSSQGQGGGLSGPSGQGIGDSSW